MQLLKKLCVYLLISFGLLLGITVSVIAANFGTTKALAMSGDADAQNRLGGMYNNGEVVSQNDGMAFEWARKSANQGHIKAQKNLGMNMNMVKAHDKTMLRQLSGTKSQPIKGILKHNIV